MEQIYKFDSFAGPIEVVRENGLYYIQSKFSGRLNKDGFKNLPREDKASDLVIEYFLSRVEAAN